MTPITFYVIFRLFLFLRCAHQALSFFLRTSAPLDCLANKSLDSFTGKIWNNNSNMKKGTIKYKFSIFASFSLLCSSNILKHSLQGISLRIIKVCKTYAVSLYEANFIAWSQSALLRHHTSLPLKKVLKTYFSILIKTLNRELCLGQKKLFFFFLGKKYLTWTDIRQWVEK